MATSNLKNLHDAVPPGTFFNRLASDDPPHPCLVLALIVYLVRLSPSTLSTPDRAPRIASLLIPHSRKLACQAAAIADGRLVDIAAAACIRAYYLYNEGRFLEGWSDASQTVGFVWVTGMGKLGGVGESMLGCNDKVQREIRLRNVRFKGTVARPPRDTHELGERIKQL
jgi:hypothetical protein